MPPTQRGVIKPPNQGEFSSNKAANSYMPLTKGAGDTHPPNLSRFLHGDPGGSADLAKRPSAIASTPNDTKFRDGDKGMTDDGRPSVAVEPGKGAVPVNPFVTDAALLGRPPAAALRSK